MRRCCPEREELPRLAQELARSATAPAELAPTAAAGRGGERWPRRSKRHARQRPCSAWRRHTRTLSARQAVDGVADAASS